MPRLRGPPWGRAWGDWSEIITHALQNRFFLKSLSQQAQATDKRGKFDSDNYGFSFFSFFSSFFFLPSFFDEGKEFSSMQCRVHKYVELGGNRVESGGLENC